VHSFFCYNLNSGAHILSKELSQDPNSLRRHSFPGQIYFALPSSLCGICHPYQAPAQLSAQKTKLAASSTFRDIPHSKKKSQKHVRTAQTSKLGSNETEKTGLLSCLGVVSQSYASCVAVPSICAAPFSSTCSTQSDNSRKLRLSCQFPWCTLTLTACSSESCA
jgi:hypothetical protein